MLFKNVASQGVYLFAYDTVNSVAKTADAANITASISKDGAGSAATGTVHPTEIGGGVYWQPLSQAETNANAVAVYWSSSTTGIQIDPLIALTTGGAIPQVPFATSGGLPTLGTGTGQINPASGKVPATVATGDDVDAATLIGRLTSTRAGYLDNLNTGGQVASHADILSLNTATALARAITSGQYLKPASLGSPIYYPISLILTNLEGQLTDADGSGGGVGGITNVVTNGTGTDRSSNFSGWTHAATGRYESTYVVVDAAPDEPLILRFSGTIGGQAFVAVAEPVVADAFSLAFNSTDRSKLNTTMLAVNALATTVGTPVTSVSADIAAVKVDTGATAATVATNLNATITSRSTYAGGAVASVTAPVTVGGYSTGQDPATLVLDPAASGHNIANSVGARINAAGSAVDPWGGVITASQAGTLIRNFGAVLVGNVVESADHSTTTFLDPIDGTTTRVTSTQTATTRTVTQH